MGDEGRKKFWNDEKRQKLIARLVRERVAEIMAAAGVDRGRIGVEVLYELPDSFVRAYELLWDRACVGDLDERIQAARAAQAEVGRAKTRNPQPRGSGTKLRVSEEGKELAEELRLLTIEEMDERLVVRDGGSRRRRNVGSEGPGSMRGVAGDERVVRLKERVDKRLRAMARDIEEELREIGEGVNEETGEMMTKVGKSVKGRSMRDFGVSPEVAGAIGQQSMRAAIEQAAAEEAAEERRGGLR